MIIIDNEIWKDVPGFEGVYQVSNLGEIKSLDRMVKFNGTMVPVKGRIKRQEKSYIDYRMICLNKNGLRERVRVHRLVAEIFISNPENKPCVNHINGIKNDNRVENLEWVTYSENIQHAFDTGLKKATMGIDRGFKLNKSDVIDIVNKRSEGLPIKQIALLYSINRNTVYKILTGRQWNKVTNLKKAS